MLNLLFSPSSLYWRVNREWLISLAGPRAVLLELAHPDVAAGVARHSNYRGDPFGRLYRTMKTMTEISFGTEEERRRSLQHFHRCHARVRGTTEETRYDARDPHVQFWVLATLIDSVPLAYEKFIAPLTWQERCEYYDDCARLARLLGIPAHIIPPTYCDLKEYMQTMLYGGALRVTEDARAVIHALFAPTLRGNFTRWFSSASIVMLPPHLRDAYGLNHSAQNEKNLERLAGVTRRIRPYLPAVLAVHPKAWAMEQRMARK